MTSTQIRQQFLDFFASKQHTIVESSPVVPLDDPTLMFANAGMNQFKDVFLGTGSRSYRRAANTQKCIRAGGKHNDLDDVGKDTYHHTFFEMLGNWSFGDYFKKEAISWAWELLTEVWGIDKSRLHATYFQGDPKEGQEPDTEAADLWRTVTDIDPSHIHRGDKKDNFWEMGDTGPCGPCSEIHIDLTPDKSGGALVNAGDARVIELWNLVFIQYNRSQDGKLTPLPAKHVDTGLGFERLCAVLQGMQAGRIGLCSNYDTDVFTPIFEAIRKRTRAPVYRGTLPGSESSDQSGEPGALARAASQTQEGPRGLKPAAGDEARESTVSDRADQDQVMIDVSYRVIADHLRCLTVAITDGAMPSNEGRGYVLRRILRRAARYARQYLDMHEPFLCDLVRPLVDHMGDAFPELRDARGGKNVEHVADILRDEEASFLKTVGIGLDHLEYVMANEFRKAICTEHKWRWSTSVLAAPFMGDYVPEARNSFSPGDYVFAFRNSSGGTEEIVLRELNATSFARYAKRPIVIPGEAAFKLHDTYGFPIDLTEQMAQERGMTVDIGEYEQLMEAAREKARAATRITHPEVISELDDFYGGTQFKGYETTSLDSAYVAAVVRDGDVVAELKEGDEGGVVLKSTPFYAERGGQVGDVGVIKGTEEDWEFRVIDVQWVGSAVVHFGFCTRGRIRTCPLPESRWSSENERRLQLDDRGWADFRISHAMANVDLQHRQPTMQNHTSTHLLNWALRAILGDHVEQEGSLVDPGKTRFDFSHRKPLAPEELNRIEALVNEQLDAKLPVFCQEVDQSKAREINTLRAVFGEKYPDRVRVVSVGADITEMLAHPKDPKWMKYSVEFCGGTHLRNAAEAERFMLISEEAVAKGIRRVVGISGEAAHQAEALGAELLKEVDELTAASAVAVGSGSTGFAPRLGAIIRRVEEATIAISVRQQLGERLTALRKVAKEQEKEVAAAETGELMKEVAALLDRSQTHNGVRIVVGEVQPAPVGALRGAIDHIRRKTDASAVVLGMVSDGKVTLLAGISRDVVEKGIKAGDLIKDVCPLVGGKGGGRPDMAQSGGADASGLPAALERAKAWLCGKLI